MLSKLSTTPFTESDLVPVTNTGNQSPAMSKLSISRVSNSVVVPVKSSIRIEPGEPLDPNAFS